MTTDDKDAGNLYFEFGCIMLRGGKHKVAESAFRKYILKNPADNRAFFNLGLCHSALGNHAEAAKSFESSFLMSPRNAEAAINAAGCLIKCKDSKRAARFCILALIIDLKSPLAMHNLNVALRMNGALQTALNLSWNRIASICDSNIFRQRPRIIGKQHPHSCIDTSISSEHEGIVVTCIKWGHKYGPEYVNRLAKSVSVNLDRAHTFICFTDDPAGINTELVHVYFLPDNANILMGWWQKACLFSPEAAVIFSRRQILYFDLDTVITGNLDELMNFEGRFATLSTCDMINENRNCGYNSSIMIWHSADAELSGIYTFLLSSYSIISSCTQKFDHWLEMCICKGSLLQDFVPTLISDYSSMLLKSQNENYLDPRVSVVLFPLLPKPHQCGGWVSHFWND